MSGNSREQVIVRTSIIGILANIVLAAFKAAVGIAANSIAVTLDAVNNLSDALSSVITIIGTKLAGKAPDKKHPFGYGRIEYMSQLIVAAIVLYAGITAMTESVQKIIHPEKADYSAVALIIIASAVAVKLVLGSYVKKKGREVNSGSLVASGSDATFDAILSLSVLASAVIFLTTGVSLEAWVGAVIALIIIKSGLEMIRDAVDEILGTRADKELTQAVKAAASEAEAVNGVYDLFMNNYGPDRYLASFHVEVPETMTVAEVDRLTRQITDNVYQKTGVATVAMGVYAANEEGSPAAKVAHEIRKIVMKHEHVLQMHGFYLDEETKSMRFDVVVDFAADDRKAIIAQIGAEVAVAYPAYTTVIALDSDISD